MANFEKTILITGSTGFIGKNVSDFLKDKYRLLTPSHRDLDLLSQKDVRNFFLQNSIDCVIHCANYGGTRKCQGDNGILEKNLRMFFNLAENSEYYDRFIHLGSGAEYNKEQGLHLVSEDEFGKNIPKDDYGFSKYVISRSIENSEKLYCLRLFGIFGKHEDYEFKFISNAIIKNLLHLPVIIRQNVNFSWLYVNDLLPVIEYFIEKEPVFSCYNITPPGTTDLLSIAQTINKISDYKSEIIVENKGFNNEYSGDNSRLSQEMDGLQFTSMESSLKELMDYYKTIIPEIDYNTILEDKYASLCKINENCNE